MADYDPSPLGARVDDPRTTIGFPHQRREVIGSSLNPSPAEGYYGEIAPRHRRRAGVGVGYGPKFNIKDGSESFRERTFVPGYQRTPELRTDQFYPTPTISHAEQEAIDAENMTRKFERGVRNRLMGLMMERMNGG